MRPVIVDWLSATPWPMLAWIVPSFKVSLAVGTLVVIAGFLAAGRHRFDTRDLLDVTLAGLVGGLLGTKLYYFLNLFVRQESVGVSQLVVGSGSWGAYLGAGVAVWWFCRRRGLDGRAILDAAVGWVPFGIAIGRVGCFLRGDDFGRVTDARWGLTFPQGSPVFRAHEAAGLVPPEATASLEVHPLQLILAANAVLVGVTLVAAKPHLAHRPGALTALFALLYSVTRFGWEFLRDPAAGGAAGISIAQGVALLITAGALTVVFRMVGGRAVLRP